MSYKAIIIALGLSWLCAGCMAHYSLFGGSLSSGHNWFGGNIKDAPQSDTKPLSFKERVLGAMHNNTAIAMLAAVIFMVLAGICFTMEHYFCALKLMLAAFAFPICAIFFELFWAWIAAAILVVIAIVAYVHYRMVIKPLDKRKK